jgi:ankyrin repeat protein
MHWAAKRGDVDMLSELDTFNTKWEARSFGGYTALHLACTHNRRDAVLLLLDFGLGVDCESS